MEHESDLLKLNNTKYTFICLSNEHEITHNLKMHNILHNKHIFYLLI